MLSGPYGQVVVPGVADPALRACLYAVHAEEAPAQVQPESLAVPRDGLCRARQGTRAATLRALRLVQYRQAPETIGERGRSARRIKDCPAALPEALPDNVDHGVSLGLQVVPAVGEVEALVAQREIGDLLVA
jgi:hypothetical protein